jgi:drug/metabolite transporter (DMT)-like permease
MATHARPVSPGAPTRYRQQLVLGAALITASEALFATMGAAVKMAAAGLPLPMIVFFRSLFGLLPFLPMLAGGVAWLRPSPGTWPLYVLRAVVGLSAMSCFFYALAHLPLADGMLLKMTAPVFMPIIAAVWLAERASRAAVIAVPVGLAGVVLVLDPTGELAPAALVGLAGGILAAWAKVSVRRLTRTEPATRVVAAFAVLASLITAPFAVATWQGPTHGQWGLLVVIGLCATGGQWLLTRGYGAASPGQIGPFTYTSVVFAGVYGALLWGEIPDAAFIAGALLIAAAGLLALRRDTTRSGTTVEEA